MFYTVAEVSSLIGLSKVSIYKKLKQKELAKHIVKKQGVTYVDEVGFKLIKDNLKLNDAVETNLNNNIQNNAEEEIAADTEYLTIKADYINTLKEELKVKNVQIQELNNRLQQEQQLHQNTQILLKSEQNKPKGDMLLLRRDRKKKGFWKRLFNI